MTDKVNSQLDYSGLIHFFENSIAQSFRNLNPDEPGLLSLEKKLNETGQFFFILDVIQLTGIFYSKGAYNFFGVKSGQMNPAVVYTAIHPDDVKRFNNARSKLIKLGMEVFNKPVGKTYLSSNFRVKNSKGQYVDLLFQDYICVAGPPVNRAFLIQLHTNITGMIHNRNGYHFYVGPDQSYFRYPDKDYLRIGYFFTKREWEIIKYIAAGLDSDQIAENLFLSIHTINRHRQNILKKTGKRSTHDLVIDFQEKGLI